jgi:CMP-N-acetylneuraminic acid synthetase
MVQDQIIAIIPARGGSKGLSRKNIRPLCNKPLVAWTIEQALNCKYFDVTIVSTDDEEIAEISQSYNAEVPFLRPKELALDTSPTFDTIKHAITWFEERDDFFDLVVLLEPTSPLRRKNDLNDALEIFMKKYEIADSLVSLGEVHMEKPYLLKNVENGFVTSFVSKEESYHQRQQLPTAYFPYGVIYLSKRDTLIRSGSFYQKRTIPFFIERWQNYEVDDLYDLICIESIFKQQFNEII